MRRYPFSSSAAPQRIGKRMSSRDVTLIVWSVIGFGVVACFALSALRPRYVATLVVSTDAFVSSPWRRAVVTLGWMWLGWHLFAR